MAEKKTPIAPATSSSPMTESLGGFDPVVPSLPDVPEIAEPVDDESFWSSFFSDDDDQEGTPEPAYGDQLHLSSTDFPGRYSAAGKSLNPEAARQAVVKAHSDANVEEIEATIDEEFNRVPVEPLESVLTMAGAKALDLSKSAYSNYMPDMAKPVIAKGVEGGGIVLGQLEYVDGPRSEAWSTAYKRASLLPDTDTRFGNVLGDLAGKSLRYYEEFNNFKNILGGTSFQSDDQEEKYYDDVEALGRNIYSAFADAKLYEKAQTTKGYFIDRPDLWGALHGGNATGQDLLDVAFPIDMMQRLHENAPKSTKEQKFKGAKSSNMMLDYLSDPVSRMGVGIALEMVADPLWMFGAAKAVTKVHYGGKVYNLGESGTRTAGHLERYSNVTGSGVLHQQTALAAVIGEGDQAAKSLVQIQEVATLAIEESNASLIRARRFQELSELVAKGENIEEGLGALRKTLNEELAELTQLAERYSDASSGGRIQADYRKVLATVEDLKDEIRFLEGATDQVELSAKLTNKADSFLNTTVAHRAAASEMRSFVEIAKRSTPAGAGVVEASKIPLFGTYHIPFTRTTGTIGTSSDIEAAGRLVSQGLDRFTFLTTGVRKVKDGYKQVASNPEIKQKVSAMHQAGMRGLESLSEGERFAWLADNIGAPLYGLGELQIKGAKKIGRGAKVAVGATKEVAIKGEKFTYAALDFFARNFLTRHWQPLLADKMLKQEMAFYGARGAHQMTLTAADEGMVRLRRLKPELWKNYQNSVTNYMNQVAFLSGEVSLKLNRLYRLAGGKDGDGGVLAQWKSKIETEEIPEIDAKIKEIKDLISNKSKDSLVLNRQLKNLESLKAERLHILSDDYKIHEFMQDVHNFVETGAGKLKGNPWLSATAEKLKQLKIEFAEATGKSLEEVEQAMTALARWASGDKRTAQDIAGQIFRLRSVYEGSNAPSFAVTKWNQITDALDVTVQAKSKLLNSVSPNKLAEIVYRTLDVAEGMPFGQEIPQAIDNVLLKALNGDRALADEILQYAAGVYGGSRESALRLFAADVSGDLKRIAEAASAGSIRVNADPTKITPFHTGGVHPLRNEYHPEYPGLTADMTLEEFIGHIRNQDREYGAIYDVENGMQISSMIGTKTSVSPESNINWRNIDDITADGNAVSVHNHPTLEGYYEPTLKSITDSIDGLINAANLKHHDHLTHIGFSYNDLISGVALNEKYIVVVNPDGTMWILERPPTGWSRNTGVTESDGFEYQYRLQSMKSEEGLLDTLTMQQDFINKEVRLELGPSIEWLKREIDELDHLLDTDVIDEQRYDQMKKLIVGSASQWILNKAQDLQNNKWLDKYEEIFGSRPYRAASPGRYQTTGAIRRVEQGDSFIVERSLLRNRIKASIQDKKIQTQTTLEEIRRYRNGTKKREDLIFVKEEILNKIAIEKGKSQFRIEKILNDAFDYDDLDEIPEQAKALLDELFHWADTDYPGGVPRVEDGRVIARTPEEWLNQKSDSLAIEGMSVEDVKSLLDEAIYIKNMDLDVQETLDTLIDAQKILETRRAKDSLSKSTLKKEANKIRKQRTEDVLKTLVEDAGSVPEARSKIRDAFDELLDLPDDPFYKSLKDSLADTLAHYSYRRKYRPTKALEATRERGRTLVGKELDRLKTKLKAEIPALRIPDSKDPVVLREWELDLWDRMKDLTASLSTEETLLSVYAALGDSPKLVNAKTIGKDAYDALKARYVHLVGRRMGELPEELEPVKEIYQGLIKQFEDLYVKNGMDFVKSPEDMLRFWGVIDYAPHLKPTPGAVLAGEPLTSQEVIAQYNKGLEEMFASGMDQRKRRTIIGTVAEINDATKETVFQIDPYNLVGRYMKAVKNISGQEFMLSLVAGKVVVPIGPKPVIDHALEVLAVRHNLFNDVDIASLPRQVVEDAVRAKASNAEIKYLDEVSDLEDIAGPKGYDPQVIPSAQRAAELGYVPLFNRAVPGVSNDLIVGGTKSDWQRAGLVPENIVDKFRITKASPEEDETRKFSTFIRESQAIRNADEIIAVLAKIKANQYANGEELYNPVARYKNLYKEEETKFSSLLKKQGKSVDEAKVITEKKRALLQERAWDAVAKEMNSKVPGFIAKVRNGSALKGFYTESAEVWNLYIPAVVKKSMDDLFTVSALAKTWPVQKLRQFNNFWKARVTIIATAFHTRNAVSNIFSNMLDSGIATFDPAVAMDAGRLTALANIYERYGSVYEAKRILSMPRGANEGALAYKTRQAGLKIVKELDPKGSTFDLGDGIARSADESVNILRERGVVAGSMQQYIDIGTFETGLADVYVAAGLEKDLEKVKKAASYVEDVAIVTMPSLIAGMPLPVGLPKKLGSFAGRSIENQARISNFIVNARKTQSFDEAARHVNLHLFDYSDLTASQKTWMRLYIPFFTWTQKNIGLQLRMMEENPVFYSNFSRFMVHQGPEMAAAAVAEEAGVPYIPGKVSSRKAIGLRDEYTRSYVKFPIRPGYNIEGVGLPLESLFEQLETVRDVGTFFKGPRLDNKKQHLRFVGQTHAIFKTLFETANQRSTFMDMPIADNTNGVRVLEQINAIRNIPFFGEGIADYAVEAAGIKTKQLYNDRNQMWMDSVMIDGYANYLLQTQPYSRVLNDAVAASLLYNMTYLDKMPADMREKYSQVEYEPIADWVKLTDALGGIRITVENEKALQARQDRAMQDARIEGYKREGIMNVYDKNYIKEQQ